MSGAHDGQGTTPAGPLAAVEQYLDAMANQDWDRLAATVAEEGLVRDGPFVDVVEGKAPYVEFLKGIISSLGHYELTVQRISPSGDRRFFVELSERFDVEGQPTTYPEVCLFETDDDGRIVYVSVFMKYPGGAGPVEGASASA